MRILAGLAILVAALVHVPSLRAQSASNFMTGVSPTNLTFTPVNTSRSLHTPSMTSGLGGFNPLGFFHKVAYSLGRPRHGGISNNLAPVNNPFPTELFQFKTDPPYQSSAQLPRMRLQTSSQR